MENRKTANRLEDHVLIPLLKKNKAKSDHPAKKPTSLTSYIGTLVERIIIEPLNWWIEHNNIITPCQAGFRSSYTTEDQLNIQLEKNPRFHIAYRQLGVECNIQPETLEQLEYASPHVSDTLAESRVFC